MQVKDMTVEQLQDLIRHTVEQCLEEYFGDPDAGLVVKKEVKQQLLASLQRQQRLSEFDAPVQYSMQKGNSSQISTEKIDELCT